MMMTTMSQPNYIYWVGHLAKSVRKGQNIHMYHNEFLTVKDNKVINLEYIWEI